MADTAKTLYGPAQPATSNGTLYTVPGSTTTVIRNIHAMNTTSSAATLNIALNGTAATAANCILFELSIPAHGSYDWSGFMSLDAAAETIQGLQGTGSAITVTISGIETA